MPERPALGRCRPSGWPMAGLKRLFHRSTVTGSGGRLDHNRWNVSTRGARDCACRRLLHRCGHYGALHPLRRRCRLHLGGWRPVDGCLGVSRPMALAGTDRSLRRGKRRCYVPLRPRPACGRSADDGQHGRSDARRLAAPAIMSRLRRSEVSRRNRHPDRVRRCRCPRCRRLRGRSRSGYGDGRRLLAELARLVHRSRARHRRLRSSRYSRSPGRHDRMGAAGERCWSW